MLISVVWGPTLHLFLVARPSLYGLGTPLPQSGSRRRRWGWGGIIPQGRVSVQCFRTVGLRKCLLSYVLVKVFGASVVKFGRRICAYESVWEKCV